MIHVRQLAMTGLWGATGELGHLLNTHLHSGIQCQEQGC